MPPTASEAIGDAIEEGKTALFKFTINQGIAVAAVVVFFAMLWYGGKWVGQELVVPSRDRMFQHLDRIEGTMEQHRSALQRLDTIMQGEVDTNRMQGEILKQQTEILRQIRDDQRNGAWRDPMKPASHAVGIGG
jgi:hypothetical protein